MNSRLCNTDHIAHGSANMIRECLAECLKMAASHALLGYDHLAVLDDIGCEYCTRRAVAYFRQAVSLLADLKEKKRQDAERRGGEPTLETLEEFGR